MYAAISASIITAFGAEEKDAIRYLDSIQSAATRNIRAPRPDRQQISSGDNGRVPKIANPRFATPVPILTFFLL